MYESALRPLFNNPLLTDAEFIMLMRNIIAGLIRDERNYPQIGNQMINLLKEYHICQKRNSINSPNNMKV